jgi:hypothetical protein
MPSFAAPTGSTEGGAPAPDWSGADPAQLQQMQAMQEQMAAMQAQLQQAQALQQTPAPATSAPAEAPPASAQPLSGYRRPESASAPPASPAPAEPAAAEQPRAELGGARPSIEGSAYESVLSDEPAPFGTESSPFARLESEQAQAAAERAASPAPFGQTASPAPDDRSASPAPTDQGDADASAFRTEPQRLVSQEAPSPASESQEEPGEVDRVMLAKEFSGLLQLDGDDDED